MKRILEQLEALTEALEDFEPQSNTVAYVTRELLRTLDQAHEMLKALAADGLTVPSTDNGEGK